MEESLRSQCERMMEHPDEEVRALVLRLVGEVDRLEQRATAPVELSKCPACGHWSLIGFKHCPLCGAQKQNDDPGN